LLALQEHAATTKSVTVNAEHAEYNAVFIDASTLCFSMMMHISSLYFANTSVASRISGVP
jgi:hypothetical protein